MKFSNTFDEIRDERSMLRIGNAREISLRFVEENVRILFRRDLEIDELDANLDVICIGIRFRSELGDFAVDGYYTFLDDLFCPAARSDAGLSY